MAILLRDSTATLDSTGAFESDAQPVVRRLPAGDHISLVTTARDFSLLENQWRDLEAAGHPGTGVFQSFDWLNAWARTYPNELCVVTGYNGENLVFAWPLMRTKLGPLNVLRWMSEPHSQYGDVLVAKGHCPTAWLGATTGFLRKLKDIDIIRLRHVRKDAAAAIYLDAHFRNARVDELAPWLDLKAFADEAAYDARYSSSQRKRRKKIRKSLEDEFGPVTFEVLTEVPLATAAVRDAITEKCQWIDERGRQNRVLCCPNLPAFLESLLRTRQGTAQLVVSRLCAGGRPISWELGIRYGAVHFCFITSHVNALTNFSPARLHMDFSQRQAIKDGMARFDLMVPNDAYKDSWCSARMATQDYHLPLSPAGRAYGSIYLETLRPHMREAYYRMPPNLLRLLKPILGH